MRPSPQGWCTHDLALLTLTLPSRRATRGFFELYI
jgi:hypothetical protein